MMLGVWCPHSPPPQGFPLPGLAYLWGSLFGLTAKLGFSGSLSGSFASWACATSLLGVPRLGG